MRVLREKVYSSGHFVVGSHMKALEVKIKREGYRFQRSILCRKLFLSA